MANPILTLARECASGDAWSDALETLYALHRLWGEYQSPAIGTSPIDAFDAGDECPTYDYIAPTLHAMPADDAARHIVHATRVMTRYADALECAGMAY